jgi:drug/metabolite transporter (DMT)-like permease
LSLDSAAPSAAVIIAFVSSLFFAIAHITARVGLRAVDARSGAAISVPTATVLFLLATPFVLDTSGFEWRAALLFAGVGLIFPATVTILTFRSNELLGPTVTSAVSGTAPLFALAGGALFLGEQVPAQAALAAVGVVVGVALLSWRREETRKGFGGLAVLWPLSGAIVRAVAQTGVKAGLLIWPHAFAAGLIGYLFSSTVVIGTDRLRSGRRPLKRLGVAWFAGTGVLNGGAVLLMYYALEQAPVWVVAPIIASSPLLTALISTAFLPDDKLSLRTATGAGITILAIVWLMLSLNPA